ncbi:MAG: holo-ACP synthase [Candidatus Protochlamydia sp.]|nr:holo-ACP synthase [Candidatus Protochlamydia sp.]
MILGIGNDIIEIKRIEHNIQRYQQRFLDRVFTPHEQGYCQKRKVPALHYAGRFAAKEAIVKALGTGFRNGLTWLDIEINNDALGKPFIKLSPKAEKVFDSPFLMISISHCSEYATAFAIWITK